MIETSELEMQRRRAAQNQAVFREVNERMEDLVATSSFVDFVCECLDDKCTESLSLTIEEYEAVRRDSNRFIVLPGHECETVEDTVEANGRYVVVAKVGSGRDVAERLNPRRS
jgi:hypothetical protein